MLKERSRPRHSKYTIYDITSNHGGPTELEHVHPGPVVLVTDQRPQFAQRQLARRATRRFQAGLPQGYAAPAYPACVERIFRPVRCSHSLLCPSIPVQRVADKRRVASDNRQQKEQKKTDDGQNYQAALEQLDAQIESVQDFWRYNNNTPVDQIKMRESIYLFKQGFKPMWEDRRNILGGSWTFRVGKNIGPDFWTRVQLMAIGEQLQSALDEGKWGK